MRGSYNLGLLSVRLSPSERKALSQGERLEGFLRGYENGRTFTDDLYVFMAKKQGLQVNGGYVLGIPEALLSDSRRWEHDLILTFPPAGKPFSAHAPSLDKNRSPGPFLSG